jgi:membrane protein required for colicin V production
MEMTSFDILVLIIVGALAAMGAVRGFVTEVLTLMAWVAAVIALRLFYPFGKTVAAGFTGSETGAAVIAFVVLFFGVFFAFRLLGRMLGERTRKSVVGPIDRVLGLGFGAVKGLIAVSLVFLVLTRGYALIWGGDEKLPEFLTAARTEPLLDVTSRAIVDYAVDRQRGSGIGDAGVRGEVADIPGHGPAADEGYPEETRDALDDLLDESGGTEI